MTSRLPGIALALTIAARSVGAQAARPSQLATLSQTVAATHIDIVYRRPVARGRELFGALIPWGEVWSPSADTAATFTVTTPVTVNEQLLPAGTYSLWAIPDRESWTIIFSNDHPAFHKRYPNGHDALRVNATPVAGEHMETLTLYFPMVDADSARLVLQWGKTAVPLSIKSKPSLGPAS